MFERIIRLFRKNVAAAAPQKPQIKNKAPLPKRVSFSTPSRAQDGTQPAQQKKPEARPQTLLLPPAEPAPAVAGKPVADQDISMPLPSSISGEEAAMAQHAVKKTSSERFTYVDRTYKTPVKQEPTKKPNDIIKYNIKPLKMPADHKEAAHGDTVYAGKTQN